MAQHFSNNRIHQLPMIISGIFYNVANHGIRLSIFKYPMVLKKCEMPLLP
ncbi:RAxF-45 family protein [Paenibacillus sp. SAF-054]